jgi:hypothetical protein
VRAYAYACVLAAWHTPQIVLFFPFLSLCLPTCAYITASASPVSILQLRSALVFSRPKVST